MWDLEVLFDALEEFAAGDVDVALVAVGFELEQDGGACAKRAICGDSERLGDLVSGQEADATDIGGEAVGIFADGLDGLVAVGSVDHVGVVL